MLIIKIPLDLKYTKIKYAKTISLNSVNDLITLGKDDLYELINIDNFNITATDKDLVEILNLFRNIPRFNINKNKTTWYGEIARFIILNLFDYYSEK